MPGPCPFGSEPMPSTTAQRAHNIQPLFRPCLSELPSASDESYPRSRVKKFMVVPDLRSLKSIQTLKGLLEWRCWIRSRGGLMGVMEMTWPNKTINKTISRGESQSE
eukprot:scaffold2533_cov127-Skeletonema_dohrnii-CCMP3373.AAC.1